jgi:hypothetical protein
MSINHAATSPPKKKYPAKRRDIHHSGQRIAGLVVVVVVVTTVVMPVSIRRGGKAGHQAQSNGCKNEITHRKLSKLSHGAGAP